jgi:hypothetical protein
VTELTITPSAGTNEARGTPETNQNTLNEADVVGGKSA